MESYTPGSPGAEVKEVGAMTLPVPVEHPAVDRVRRLLADMRLQISTRTYFAEHAQLPGDGGEAIVVKRLTVDGVRSHTTPFALRRAVERYIGNHEMLGTPVPRIHGLISTQDDLYEVASWEGISFERWLQNASADEAYPTLVSFLRGIRGFLGQGGEFFETGMDLRLSNFAINGEGVARFIDFHPPLVRVDGRWWVHIPPPTLGSAEERSNLERKFTAAGAMRRFYYDLLALEPAWSSRYWQLLDDSLDRTVFERVREKLARLPTMRFGELSRSERTQLVSKTPMEDYDTLRELGALLLPFRSPEERARDMHRVFGLTRKDASEEFPDLHEHRLVRYRTWLLEHI